MGIVVTAEVGLPLPDEHTNKEEELGFRERAHVLCRTVLITHGGQENIPITQQDSQEAARMFAQSYIPTKPAPKPGAILKLEAMLSLYDHQVVETATQLRTYVTNKLIEESGGPDAKIRIKALELLGKIGDVGLFAEKIEVSIQERRTEEIDEILREKLGRFMGRVQEIQDVPEEDIKPIPKKPLEDIDFDDEWGDGGGDK